MSIPTAKPELDSLTLQLWKQLVQELSHIKQQHTQVVFANSLAAEDMVIQHAIQEAQLNITSFMLDTGRLHAETLALLDRVNAHYDVNIVRLQPNANAVDAHVSEHGAYAFYDSLELRKACCHIRKVEPLRHYLKDKSAWITGQRREQSLTRDALQKSESDAAFGLHKYNPLCDWTQEQVWAVIHAFSIPYNPLHDQGYPSIGCDPCTRAIRPGEDIRAGRWWWEQRNNSECGLHVQATPITTETT